MTRPDYLDEMAEDLQVYDVIQGGWEHESHGIQFNAHHVLTHLAGTLTTKDFSDPELVRNAIAPDSVQYGLRLARWSSSDRPRLLDRATYERFGGTVPPFTQALGSMPVGFASFVEATSVLAKSAHNMDHEATQREAMMDSYHSRMFAAGLLVESATLQSQQYDFDLHESFNERLASLRERFGIPLP